MLHRARDLVSKRAFATVLGLALVGALLAISHPVQIWSVVRQTPGWVLVLVVLLNVPIIGLRAFRTYLILRRWGYALPWSMLLRVQLVGQTWSTATPAATGDYVRAYMWRRSAQVPVRMGAAVVTFERLFSLGLMIALAILLIAFPRHGIVGWAGVAVGLIAATFIPLLLEQTPPNLERRLVAAITRGPLSRFAEGSSELVENFRQILRAPLLLAQSSVVTLAIFVVSGAQVWLFLLGLHHRVPITQAVATYSFSQAVGILSSLPFGVGASDSAIVALLAGYGVTIATSTSVALLLRGASTLPQAVAGVVAYLATRNRTE